MRKYRKLTLLALAPLAFTIFGGANAGAVLECGSSPGASAADEPNDERGHEEPLVYGSDTIDIITINPEVAVAFQDEGDADTEGDGTSASAGETGAVDDGNDERPSSCLLRTHDAIDVLTINPEVSVSVDDDLILDGNRDGQPGASS